MVVLMLGVQLAANYFAQGADDGAEGGEPPYRYGDKADYQSKDEWVGATGRIVWYGYKKSGTCDSILLIPGTQLLGTGVLAFFYFLALVYLFLGISIVADIFMSGIEKITSQKKVVTIKKDGEEYRTKKVEVWNATVANLTLMALGSSAPEILLAVMETC
jgi:hypothetical protein